MIHTRINYIRFTSPYSLTFSSFKISIAVLFLCSTATRSVEHLNSSICRAMHGDDSPLSGFCREICKEAVNVAMHINGSLRARSLVNRSIELTCRQRHNLNLRRSQETLANYLPNAFQDLPADNGKANLFG